MNKIFLSLMISLSILSISAPYSFAENNEKGYELIVTPEEEEKDAIKKDVAKSEEEEILDLSSEAQRIFAPDQRIN